MKFSQFRMLVEAKGLSARECGPDHWQIVGGRNLINVWPNTRRGFRMQQAGCKSTVGDVQAAIQLAGMPVEQPVHRQVGPPTNATAPWEPTRGEVVCSRPPRVGLIRWLWRLLW